MQGLLLFYKPIDWRNKDILIFFQKTFGKNIKVGHSGTLDPFAEGLMVMGLGRKFTRQLHDLLLNTKKEYIAKIELGKTSDTYDVTGSITKLPLKHKIMKEDIEEIISKEFLGEKIQIPPVYSAKKHKGKRLRDIVDSENIEEIVKSKSKKVTLYDFEIISYTYPFLEIRLSVSSGYYIRSFGNDLGEKLGTGAYLTELKRTKLGNYFVENSLLPDDFKNLLELRGKIFGNVQGVGFRYFTKEQADKLAISGYSKNKDSGSVEFLAQGNLDSLLKFQTEIIQLSSGQILKSSDPIKISDYGFIIQKLSQIYKTFEIL